MKTIYLIFIELFYSLWSIFFISGDKSYMLADGLNVLGYVCTEAWKTSRGSSLWIINFISNGIYSYIYPQWMHCNQDPPYFLIYILNQLFIILTILITCKYVKDNLSRLILLFSVIYGSFTSGVASKEAFLGFIFTLLATFIVKNLREENNIKKKIWVTLVILILILTLSLSRLTYIIILIPFLYSICVIKNKVNPLIKISNKLLLLIITIAPFAITLNVISYILDISGLSFGSILLDYIDRFKYLEAEDSVGFLTSSFTIKGSIYKVLVTIFGYKHLLYSINDKNTPLTISYFCTKISIAYIILKSYYLIIRNYLFKNTVNNYSFESIYLSLLLAANLLSIFIYPYAHERYFLPSTSFALIIISFYNSYTKKSNGIHLI